MLKEREASEFPSVSLLIISPYFGEMAAGFLSPLMKI